MKLSYFRTQNRDGEVIGQIIEYAANAPNSWTPGTVRQNATEFWKNQSPPKELDQVLSEEFGEKLDIEDFWKKVEENLRNGKIRLIIAADKLRPEMRRMIEYLNKEMQNTEVLGLELRCYGKESGSLVLVPRLIGQTQSTIDKKVVGSGKQEWTIDKLKAAYANLSNRELARKVQKILDWADTNKFFMTADAKYPTFGIRGKSKERIISFMSDGKIYFLMEEWRYPGGPAERDKLVDELK